MMTDREYWSREDGSICDAYDPLRQRIVKMYGEEVDKSFFPPVTLTALEPDTAVLGSDDIVLTCVGSGFIPGAVTIVFNGFDEPTTVIDDAHCSTGVKPSIFTVAESLPVTIRGAAGETASLPFTFTEAAGRKRK
jgi:hypothetical protein